MKVAGLLLAAGRSSRFGEADKLATPLRGMPLALHAARTLASVSLHTRIVVTGVAGSARLPWPAFEIVENMQPEAGVSHSIALGLAAVRRAGADAVLVALADMPFVPHAHFCHLLDSYRGSNCIVASSNGLQRSPPALFGDAWFAALEQLTGDKGARELLAGAQTVELDAHYLLDIDCADDLPTD